MKHTLPGLAILGTAATILLLTAITACSDSETTGGGSDAPAQPSNPPQAQTAPRNPWLAAEHYSITHFNSAQTDAFPYAVKDGTFTANPDDCPAAWSGPVNLMTLASTSPDFMWGMSSDRVSYLRVAGGKLERVAEAALPGVQARTQEQLSALTKEYASLADLEKAAKEILGEQPQKSMANGNYVLCDKDNYAYTNAGRTIARYRLANPARPEDGIVLDAQINLTGKIFGSFTLVGTTMTYDGNLIVASQKGLLLIDRELKGIKDTYPLPEGQILTNSMAVDENAVYVASNSTEPGGRGLMQKIMCKGGKFSTAEADGAWKAQYDGGPAAPSIKLGYGTGSTPTLMGFGDEEDKLVVITDGAKRMKLTAFWRDGIPADAKPVEEGNPRLAGTFEVSCGLPAGTEWVQSEQSVVAGGYDAFVVNNINVTEQQAKDKIIGVLAIGPILEGPKGMECVRWNVKENKWESLWTRADISSISMIPSLSTASGLVFVNGWYEESGWEVTGLDRQTGATRHRVKFGKNNRGNGAYAILQYLPDGDLLFNSVVGPFRVHLN